MNLKPFRCLGHVLNRIIVLLRDLGRSMQSVSCVFVLCSLLFIHFKLNIGQWATEEFHGLQRTLCGF